MRNQKKIQIVIVPVFLLITFMVFGCAGGSVTMTANKLDYAVSTSQGLYDPQFKLLSEENYEKLGGFSFNVSRWSLLWSIIPLSQNPDISEELNNAIKEKGGDAIINLQVNVSSVTGGACFPNFFAAIVPVIPGVVVATVSGDVVKVRK